SKTAEWAEGPDVANREHNGLRVNTMAIQGDSESGLVSAALDLMGKTEVALASAAALPANRYRLTDFCFKDVTLTVDGSAVEIAMFNLAIANGLKPRYLNGTTPAHLPRTTRVINFAFQLVKNSDTYH